MPSRPNEAMARTYRFAREASNENIDRFLHLQTHLRNKATARDAAGAKASADEATAHLNALGAAFTAYVTAHHGILPDNLQQLRPFIGADPSYDDLLKNPRTGASPGFIYIRSAARMSMLKNPGSTPILFESRNGLRDPAGAIGYADGQVKAR